MPNAEFQNIRAAHEPQVRYDQRDGRHYFQTGEGSIVVDLIGNPLSVPGARSWSLIVRCGERVILERRPLAPDSPETMARYAESNAIRPQDRESVRRYLRATAYRFREVFQGSPNPTPQADARPQGTSPALSSPAPATTPVIHQRWRQPDSRQAAASRFPILTDTDLDALPDPEWDVEGVLPTGGLSTIIGKWEHGKTFVALDLALHIATGRAWHGRAVKQGTVLYISPEGTSGLKLRVRAWKAHHNVTGSVPIHFITVPVDLTNKDDPGALLEAIRAKLPAGVRLIVVDTLARAMSGNENAKEDMGRAIAATDLLRSETGATVMLVHHFGWQGEHSRGSSALPAAVDSETSVEKDGDTVTLRNTKMKDADRFAELAFRLTEVPGMKSRVLVRAAAVTPLGELTSRAVRLLQGLQRISRLGQVTPEEEWKEAVGYGEPGMRRSTYITARGELLDHACVKQGEGEYANSWWVTPLGHAILNELNRPPDGSDAAWTRGLNPSGWTGTQPEASNGSPET